MVSHQLGRPAPQAAPLRDLCVLRVSALDSSSLGLTLNLRLSTFNCLSFLSSSSPHLCALCVLCGENSSSFRASLISRHSPLTTNSFTIRTSKTPLPQPLYNPHLQAPLGSAGNKGLITPLESALTSTAGNKGLITPLESALTKNSPVTPVESALTKRWGVGPCFASGTRHLQPDSSSFIFIRFQTLLRFFAPIKNSTPLFSSNSELFAKNTRGWGGQ